MIGIRASSRCVRMLLALVLCMQHEGSHARISEVYVLGERHTYVLSGRWDWLQAASHLTRQDVVDHEAVRAARKTKHDDVTARTGRLRQF